MVTGNRKPVCLVISTNKGRCFRQANTKYCLYTQTLKTATKDPKQKQPFLISESADANFCHCF